MKDRGHLPLTALRAFEVAARHGGLKQACMELNLTPGAISQQVRTLERHIGLALFDRASGRYQPTQEGVQLLARLTRCFDDMEAAVREAMAHSEPRRLRLKLAPTFAARWLAPRLGSLLSQCPGIDLEVVTVSGPAEISLEQCDFLVRFGVAPWPEHDAIFLFGDDLVTVCSPDLAARIKSPRDLRRQILLHSLLRERYWHQWLASAGLDTDIADAGPRFPDALMVSEAAANGSGVAVMQWAYVRADVESGRLAMPFSHHATSENGYYMTSSSARRDEKKMREFSSWVTQGAQA